MTMTGATASSQPHRAVPHRRLKIALFSDTFPPQVNGVAHVVAQAASCMADLGHDVHVLTASQGSKEFLEDLSRSKYVVHNMHSVPSAVYPDLRLTVPMATNALNLKGWQPNIVHTHTPFGVGWAAVRCAKRFGVPLIGTHHTFFDTYLKHIRLDGKLTRGFSWKLTVKYLAQCDLVLSPSRSLCEDLKKNGLETPMCVAPNPIDTVLFHGPRSCTGDINRGPRLIYMGRLSLEKSLDHVITAFSYVNREIPDSTLTLIGDGPERWALEQQALGLGLTRKVRFTGLLRGEALADGLRAGDLFVTASKTENVPLSVLEAMACGLPVAAVAMKGMPEIVHDGVNGLLSRPDRPEEMARRIVALLRDPDTLGRYSEAAEEFAKHFSQERVMAEWEEIYQSVHARSL